MIEAAEVHARIEDLAGFLDRVRRRAAPLDLVALNRRVAGLCRCVAERPRAELPVYLPEIRLLAETISDIAAARRQPAHDGARP